MSTFRHVEGTANVHLPLKSHGLQMEISNPFNLPVPNLGPVAWRLSMHCVRKLWKGTGVSSVCPSRSTPASLRCFRLGSWDFGGGLIPKPRGPRWEVP